MGNEKIKANLEVGTVELDNLCKGLNQDGVEFKVVNGLATLNYTFSGLKFFSVANVLNIDHQTYMHLKIDNSISVTGNEEKVDGYVRYTVDVLEGLTIKEAKTLNDHFHNLITLVFNNLKRKQ